MINDEKIRDEICKLFFDDMYTLNQIRRYFKKQYAIYEIRQVIFDKIDSKK